MDTSHGKNPEHITANFRSGVPDLERATELTAAGFTQPVSLELRADVENHLAGDFERTITTPKGEEIGFAVFKRLDVLTGYDAMARMLYLQGIIIEPSYQGKHIAGSVIDMMLERERFDFFGFRTQSSIMYAAAARRFAEIFPALDGRRIPGDVDRVGMQLAGYIESQFPLHEGCYGGPLYGEKPVHRDADYQAAFDRLCPNFERGDAVLCIATNHRREV